MHSLQHLPRECVLTSPALFPIAPMLPLHWALLSRITPFLLPILTQTAINYFSHPDVPWRDNTLGQKQSRRFLEFTDNLFLTVTEEPTRRGSVLDLILTNNEELVGNVKGEASLGCSDHEMVEFRIFEAGRTVKNNLTALEFRRADSGLFKVLLGRVPGGKAEEGLKKADYCSRITCSQLRRHLPHWTEGQSKMLGGLSR